MELSFEPPPTYCLVFLDHTLGIPKEKYSYLQQQYCSYRFKKSYKLTSYEYSDI